MPQDRSGRAENLAHPGIRSPDRPALSQSLYRLNYPAHSDDVNGVILIGTKTRHLVIRVLLPTDAPENCFKRSIKIYIKTAPTCFGVITIIRGRITGAC